MVRIGVQLIIRLYRLIGLPDPRDRMMREPKATLRELYKRVWELSSPYRFFQHKEIKIIAQRLGRQRYVLDAGGSDYKPYQGYFQYEKYLNCDLRGSVDIHASVTRLPVKDEAIDCIVCTEVLEHVDDVKAALQEFHRVLKPGGYLVTTTPFLVVGIHEDFSRWTDAGLSMMLLKGGFDILDIKRLGGVFSTMAENLRQILPSLFGRFSKKDVKDVSGPSSYVKYGFISFLNLLLIPVCKVISFLDVLDRNRIHCCGFLSLVQKPMRTMNK